MPLVADQGLALFAGLNAIPKRSYLSEYSNRIDHLKTTRLLAAWQQAVTQTDLLDGSSFNLDFHSVPYFGEHPVVENHYVAMRSRGQPSALVFLAQDAAGHSFCYSNADIRRGEERDEILRFIDFWKSTRGEQPKHLKGSAELEAKANESFEIETGWIVEDRADRLRLATEFAGMPEPSASPIVRETA